MTLKPPTDHQGFTLTELIIATAISLLTASVAGDLLISHIRSSERAEALERQRSNWARTTTFIEAEVALSERVYSPIGATDATLPVAIPATCGIEANDVRLELDLRRDLPPVIYAVKQSGDGWLGENTLWRCGPSISAFGNYCTQADIQNAESSCYQLPYISSAPILDGLDSGAPGAGFSATASADAKQTDFTLALKGHARISYKQTDAARTRISPLYARPSENSLCDASNLVKLEGSSDTADNLVMSIGMVDVGEDILICGRGLGSEETGAVGDSVTGSDNANDILEAGDYGRATLDGKGGNDVLRGTLEADTLNGGSGDDVLVGRDGNDTLNGGSEHNSYLPGGGDDIVIGGSGLDVVFFSGNRTDYELDGCTQSSCTVTDNRATGSDGSDTLSNIEILIFQDARVDLPDSSP